VGGGSWGRMRGGQWVRGTEGRKCGGGYSRPVVFCGVCQRGLIGVRGDRWGREWERGEDLSGREWGMGRGFKGGLRGGSRGGRGMGRRLMCGLMGIGG